MQPHALSLNTHPSCARRVIEELYAGEGAPGIFEEGELDTWASDMRVRARGRKGRKGLAV